MSIRFRCKNCNQKYELDDDWLGEIAECVKCGELLPIPARSEQLAPDTPLSDSPHQLEKTVPLIDIFHPRKVKKIKNISSFGPDASANDIVFRCKICDQKYRLPVDLAGKVAECGKCKRNMLIPLLSEEQPKPQVKTEGAADITFWCEFCGQKYRLPPSLAGQQAECTRCKKAFVVPVVSQNVPPQNMSNNRQLPGSAGTVSPAERPNERTQTFIEMTKTVRLMVRYVVELPEHNLFFAWMIMIFDWLRQFRMFSNLSRGGAIMGGVTIILLIALGVVTAFSDNKSPNAPQPCMFHTQCFKCNNRQEQSFVDIGFAKCSKCGDKCGYAWKCFTCDKYFPYIEPVAEQTKSKNEMLLKLKPPQCKFCRSTNISYAGLNSLNSK